MTEPLALVFYERLLPGTQLINRLRDLHYRVSTVSDAQALPAVAEQNPPMLLLVDLQVARGDVLAAVARVKACPATSHLPVVGFTNEEEEAVHATARAAGASVVVQDQALLEHLPQWLEQALRVE